MKLLLTHGYFLEEDKHEKKIMKPYPPLGILYISSYLKSAGHEVDILDSTFQKKKDYTYYLDYHPDISVVGIYCNLMTKLNVLDMIRQAKERGLVVILGGPEPASYTGEFINAGADVVVIGEGEQTMLELMEAIPRSGFHNLHQVAGISFKDENGEIVHTPPRTLIDKLDTVPFPDRDAIDIKQYINTWQTYHGHGAVSLITARGCPYTCTWCSHGVYGFTHRRRTPGNVVDEIQLLREQYNPDMLWFADDVFTINYKWFYEYYAEMNRRGIHIPFECISRPDRVTEDILSKMADLGCFRIWFGSESGSQRILDAMSRRVSTDEIRNMTATAQRYGIEIGLFVMLGYDGETTGDIQETIEHLKQTQADTFLTTVAYPIKGTEYYERVRDRINTKLPWSERTERDNDVRGRLNSTYYWFAQRRMTNEVRYHIISNGHNSNLLEKAKTFSKAKISQFGMYLTGRWKS